MARLGPGRVFLVDREIFAFFFMKLLGLVMIEHD